MQEQKRGIRIVVALAALALVVALAAATPSPFAIERPGPVVDIFGSIDTEQGAEDVLSIDGAKTFETSGEINLLTVYISGTPAQRNSWLTVLGSLFDRTADRVPIERIFPDGLTAEQREAQNAALMEQSQMQAVAAALNELGTPVTSKLEVGAVKTGGPADGVLEPGDQLVSVDGVPVETAAALRAAIAEAVAGDSRAVTIGIERDGAPLDVLVTPETSETNPTPLIGIEVLLAFTVPYDVDLNLDRIGGPSAGLALALAVYDQLTPGELTGGLTVSATGTISENGAVGAIGGLPQKLWGASSVGTDLMLMPLENCAMLPSNLPKDLVIVPVSSLEEAIAAVETAASRERPVGIERCRVS